LKFSASDRTDILKRDNENDINNLTMSVEHLCEKVEVHIVQTRKELDNQGKEVTSSSKTVLASICTHKAQTESIVVYLRRKYLRTEGILIKQPKLQPE
jgi:hypothetical protein